jgi:hypothetical protein
MPLIPTEKSESSTLFSLNELMKLERARVTEEEAARAARRKAEQDTARAAEEKARANEQARLDRERDARETAERHKNEERARLEGLRQAELVRAQAEVETQRQEHEHEIRSAEAAVQREHEHLLATVTADAGYRRLATLACGMAALFAIAGVTTGGLWHSASQTWEAERGELKESLALALAKLDYRDDTIEDLNERVSSLETDRTSLAEQVRTLQRNAGERSPPIKEPRKHPTPQPQPVVVPPEPEPQAPCVDDGDPMNDCMDLG